MKRKRRLWGRNFKTYREAFEWGKSQNKNIPIKLYAEYLPKTKKWYSRIRGRFVSEKSAKPSRGMGRFQNLVRQGRKYRPDLTYEEIRSETAREIKEIRKLPKEERADALADWKDEFWYVD